MSLTVGSICRSVYPEISWDASIRDAAARMRTEKTRWLTVTAEGHVVGMVSDWDILRRAVLDGLDRDRTSVESIMRVGLPVCSPHATPREAARIMKRKGVRQIAVVDDAPERAIVGIVRLEDILRALPPGELEREFLLALM